MIGVAVKDATGEWVAVGHTERVPRGSNANVTFSSPVFIQHGGDRKRQLRFSVFDIKETISDEAFLHITGDSLIGSVELDSSELAGGKTHGVGVLKDGKAVDGCRIVFHSTSAPSSGKAGQIPVRVTALGMLMEAVCCVGLGWDWEC